MRYEIRGEIEGVGQVKHVVRATDRTAAWARIKRAYSKRKSTLLDVRELRDGRRRYG
jgi:hypothetical protein